MHMCIMPVICMHSNTSQWYAGNRFCGLKDRKDWLMVEALILKSIVLVLLAMRSIHMCSYLSLLVVSMFLV